MKFERIRSPEVPELEPGSLSNCKKVGDQVFISGLIAWDENLEIIGKSDAYIQAKTAFSYMKALIEAAGGNAVSRRWVSMLRTTSPRSPSS